MEGLSIRIVPWVIPEDFDETILGKTANGCWAPNASHWVKSFHDVTALELGQRRLAWGQFLKVAFHGLRLLGRLARCRFCRCVLHARRRGILLAEGIVLAQRRLPVHAHKLGSQGSRNDADRRQDAQLGG
jgi:hypothetical protein